MQIRKASAKDAAAIQRLYTATASFPGGLARMAAEITDTYIEHNLNNALATGICLVAEHPDDSAQLVAEIHCYKLQPAVFKHVLGELTISVHPDFQGQGLGRRIFETLLHEIRDHRPEILRVELITRESNTRAIELYQKLGFQIEGRLENRIEGTQGKEADIPMAWFNPNYGNR
ncbi:MAG: N-acetyltransferase [Bacteroidota bacterium]